MLATIQSAALNGLNAFPVTIEVNSLEAPEGGSRFTIVGLPDSAVKESSERVQAAVRENGYQYQMRTTVVNLSPADVRKEGSGFDLPIAIAFLLSLGHLHADNIDLQRYMFVGELGLGGQVLPVKGALPIAIKARELKYEALIVPEENAREAAVVNNLKVYGVKHLQDVIALLQGNSLFIPTEVNTREEFYASQQEFDFDFSEVKGQENVKRAFEVAAAGGHNIILIGSPGCGKSMMAKRLPSILPPLSLQESLETTQIHSIAGKLHRDSTLISQRPFRSPHHTVSDVALVGDGSNFMPGEICLAHNGVLF
ncbi:MAG: ATP-binding protein, partial [Bacteroidaceae bacterium]|nr:ATP-binding protein [Bacteroidaceae bacterium]